MKLIRLIPYLFLILLAFVQVANTSRISRNKEPNPGVSYHRVPRQLNPNWMSHLPDSRKITEITIPGTHDSGAYKSHGLITAWVRTQSWTLEQQLQAGIRFLDIRLRCIGNLFTIHHGAVYLELNFEDVLKVLRRFLRQHPREFVLMRVKEEHTREDCTQTHNNIFWYTYMKHMNYESLFNFSSEIPTLGQVRGKVVPLFNFAWGGTGLKYDDPTKVHVSDSYDVGAIGMDGKRQTILKQIDHAMTGPKNFFYINFCSGVSALNTPLQVALGTNYIAQTRYGKMGVVIADFPSEDWIKHLIDQNKKK